MDLLVRQYSNPEASSSAVSRKVIKEEEKSDELVNGLGQGDVVMKTCDLCYEDSAEDEFYSLACQHVFCKPCFEEYLVNLINDGKVVNINCLQGGCDRQFSEEEVRDCVDDEIFKKYKRF